VRSRSSDAASVPKRPSIENKDQPAQCNESAHTADDGATIFQQACKLGLEGIVSKRLSAPYRSGRSRDWLKVKNPDSPSVIRAGEAEW
jgi:ATP-dependent DNA ligase